MPSIISSTKLRNEYNEVSRTCHEQMSPVFVTRNGDGGLAVMSIGAYEALARRAQLVQESACSMDPATGQKCSKDQDK